jgi:L-threonylcarbamoyladenylate synthase
MKEEINKVVEVLKSGGVILYPTDTVWGLGCDATNAKAVGRIYKIKKREESKTLITLLDSFDKLPDYVNNIPETIFDFLNSVTSPVTIIYSDAKNLAKNVMTRDKTAAIRIVRDEFCKEMIHKFGKPIVSTSANISGEEAPLYYNMISHEIVKTVNYTVNLYHDRINQLKPSTILKLLPNGEFKIIRS